MTVTPRCSLFFSHLVTNALASLELFKLLQLCIVLLIIIKADVESDGFILLHWDLYQDILGVVNLNKIFLNNFMLSKTLLAPLRTLRLGLNHEVF